ncbi:MAG: hypothetical protein Q4D93_06435 [Porphyromonas sp.]|nr:hypothetical protein [Porphyromonas sp.]
MMRLLPIFLLSSLLLLTSCESKESRAAKQLLSEAEQSLADERYDDALIQLDSLHNTYPKALQERKVAMALAREVKMQQGRRDSAYLQPLLEQTLHAADSMYLAFTLIEAKGMADENVIRYQGYNPAKAQPEVSFLDIYIDSKGTLELVAGRSGFAPIGVESIKIMDTKSGSYVLSDTIPYDGGMNYRYENLGRHYERLTFSDDRAAELASYVASAPDGANLRVDFGLGGERRGGAFTLTRTAVKAIKQTYTYYATLKSIEDMQLQLKKYEKRKEIYTQP